MKITNQEILENINFKYQSIHVSTQQEIISKKD